MAFKDEGPNYLIEYAQNKLLITSGPSHSYTVSNWKEVRIIFGPEHYNLNYYVLPLPGFDETTFPFFAVCGTKNLSILNVNTHV